MLMTSPARAVPSPLAGEGSARERVGVRRCAIHDPHPTAFGRSTLPRKGRARPNVQLIFILEQVLNGLLSASTTC